MLQKSLFAIVLAGFFVQANASDQLLSQEKLEIQQEQIDACVDKGQGDACSFTTSDDDSFDGTCTLTSPTDVDAPLVCIPLSP